MAEEQEFNISLEPTIYFYVNKDNGEVEYVSMYTLFGNTVRAKGEKWTMGTRDMLAKYYSPNYEIWSYDWSNEDDTPGSTESADPDDDADWEIELVSRWGEGEDLNRADLEGTCKLVNSGEYMSAEEAESIPGE